MPTLLILMILGAMAFAFWSASRAAAEQAILLGGDACRTAGVQLIDHTVHASGLRLRRGEDGRLGFERSFRFEYSEDGTDRHIARLILRGARLVSFSGPMQPSTRIALERTPTGSSALEWNMPGDRNRPDGSVSSRSIAGQEVPQRLTHQHTQDLNQQD